MSIRKFFVNFIPFNEQFFNWKFAYMHWLKELETRSIILTFSIPKVVEMYLKFGCKCRIFWLFPIAIWWNDDTTVTLNIKNDVLKCKKRIKQLPINVYMHWLKELETRSIILISSIPKVVEMYLQFSCKYYIF